MNKYIPVIGLEVHVELNTETKMFCRCSANYFGAKPNTHTCPVCLGLPGALPFINEKAIESCMKIGLALNCSINERSYFERKNYFYPDLAKGFQTSQLVLPVAVNGWLDVENEKGEISKIRINRAHQEEDTAKLNHQLGISNDKLQISNGSKITAIDFNRSGVPLVEIVTEPDFTDSSQVRDYAKKLQQLFRYLGVSNADMERGDMRLEANISVRPVGQKELPPYRVELKNINSFRFMVAAVEYEVKRQIKALENGEKLVQETRGWNEQKKCTYIQRVKEEANDYRYFPEPDLPEMQISNIKYQISNIQSEMPELPAEKVMRFIEEFELPKKDAQILSESLMMSSFFERSVELGALQQITPKQIANFIINRKIDIETQEPEMIIEEIINAKSGRVDDEMELERICLEVIAENPDLVDKFKAGKTSIIQAIIGLVMRKTSGKANADKVKTILEKFLLPSHGL